MADGSRRATAALEAADNIGIPTFGVPEEFGGMQLDPATEV